MFFSCVFQLNGERSQKLPFFPVVATSVAPEVVDILNESVEIYHPL